MNWFKKSSTNTSNFWIELNSEDQFLQLLKENKQFAIFKHSTRCSISSMAKSRLEECGDLDAPLPIYYLDVLQYRNISNLIADKLKVIHQSPQLILVKEGKVVYNASHSGINMEGIKSFI